MKKEILDIVDRLKNKKSTDCADFDRSLVKRIIKSVVQPLAYICNQSLKTGVFPKNMKTAKVIPIFKSGNRHILSNYRPVSLLSQFSTILEKLFYTRLEDFITKHNLLSEQQYGFRTKRTSYGLYRKHNISNRK